MANQPTNPAELAAREIVMWISRATPNADPALEHDPLLVPELIEIITRHCAPAPSLATPLCPVHQELENKGKLECAVGGNNCVACSLNERAELLKLLEPFAAEGNVEDSVTVMRRVCGFYATHAGDGRVVVSYPASTTQPPLSSVKVLVALDEDARVRECVVLTDDRQADELFYRLRSIWGGANVAMASRRVDDLPKNLEEKIADVTEIIQ